MGWFALGGIVGFLLYRWWHYQFSDANADRKLIEWLAIALPIVAVLLFLLSGYFDVVQAWLATTAEAVARGSIARALFGIILGFGAGFAIQQRLDHQRLPESDLAKLVAKLVPAKSEDQFGVGGPISIAALIVLLAGITPYLDGWLRHVTSIKLPYGEFEVGSFAAHKTITADGLIYLTDAFSLQGLAKYGDKITQDIQYMDNFEIPALTQEIAADKVIDGEQGFDIEQLQKELEKKQDILKRSKNLLPAFEQLLSPVAQCAQEAINQGLNINNVRRVVRPLADDLEIIIVQQQNAAAAQDLKAERERLWSDLWSGIKQLPSKIRDFTYDTTDPQKPTIRAECQDDKTSFELPTFDAYKDVPYLYVTGILYASFVRDDELASKILEVAARNLKYKDYEYLYYTSYIGYYKGSLAPAAVLGALDEMRQTARSHLQTLESARRQCEQSKCDPSKVQLIDSLSRRERRAELRAMNDIAYYVADSMARGVTAAETYRPIAQEYAADLFRALTNDSASSDIHYELLDTYSYVSLVMETRQALPDQRIIKTMRENLEKVVAHLESIEDKGPLDPTEQYNLTVARSHLASARALED
jgi:hypothetical protein